MGNKADLLEEREVLKEEGEKLAVNFKIPFYEISAKENLNLEDSFDKLISMVQARNIRYENNLNLEQPQGGFINLGCCR